MVTYKLLLKTVFFFHEIINPPGALPAGFNLISYPVIPAINEASGIADSKNFPGHVWVQEDSGNPTQLHLLSHKGKVVRKVFLAGIKNKDWEDMALVRKQILIGDIGDNQQIRGDYSFYIFPEPVAGQDTINNIKRLKFRYPDKSHDAEAFITDPKTGDIFIITKRDSVGLIYRLAAPYKFDKLNEVKLVGKLRYSGVVSAALSPDEKKLLVKTYTNLYQYKRIAAQNIPVTLTQSYTNLPYQIEPQGEAVTFAQDNTGFFTLSEKSFGQDVMIYFYPAKK